MIKELCMPEHSKDLMNLDKLTLPKLIWLIKIPWQEIPQIYLYFSLTDSLYISILIFNATKNTFHS